MIALLAVILIFTGCQAPPASINERDHYRSMAVIKILDKEFDITNEGNKQFVHGKVTFTNISPKAGMNLKVQAVFMSQNRVLHTVDHIFRNEIHQDEVKIWKFSTEFFINPMEDEFIDVKINGWVDNSPF